MDSRPSSGGASSNAVGDADDDDEFHFAGFAFDSRRDELRKDGAAIAIAIRPKPRALLRYLLDHPGRLVAKSELMQALWGPVIVSDDSLVQCVGELRAALDDRGQLIKTLPKRGYMLDVAVDRRATRPQSLPPAEPPGAHAAPTDAGRSRRRWATALVCASLLGAAGAVWKLRQPVPFRIDEEVTARHAVAVLPLVDADKGDGGVPGIGMALADDIGAQIATRQLTRVVGPGATARYDPATPDLLRIGHELGVHYVIAGRVVHEGASFVVDCRLTSIDTGQVARLARASFPTASDAMRSNLDQKVASALRMQWYEADNARATQPGHVLDAADLTVLGWRDLNRFLSRDDILRARSRFEAALRVDPDSVLALQGLGSTYQIEITGQFGKTPQLLLEPGMRALRRALELSPDRPENLLPWGSLLDLSGLPAEAMAVYAKALEINPNYAFAHIFVAQALIRQGRYAEAESEVAKARGLSPADARMLYAVYAQSAMAAFMQGKDDAAYAWAMRWAAEFPTSGQPYGILAAIDALHGRDADASAHMARSRELLPNDTIAYVEFLNPSTDADYLRQRGRLVEGLRKAGMPER